MALRPRGSGSVKVCKQEARTSSEYLTLFRKVSDVQNITSRAVSRLWSRAFFQSSVTCDYLCRHVGRSRLFHCGFFCPPGTGSDGGAWQSGSVTGSSPAQLYSWHISRAAGQTTDSGRATSEIEKKWVDNWKQKTSSDAILVRCRTEKRFWTKLSRWSRNFMHWVKEISNALACFSGFL